MTTSNPPDPSDNPYEGVVRALQAALPGAVLVGIDERLVMRGDCDPVPVCRADARLAVAVRLELSALPMLLATARGLAARCATQSKADADVRGAADALVIDFDLGLEHSPEEHELPPCDAAHFYAALRFHAVCALEWEEEMLARLVGVIGGGSAETPSPAGLAN